MDAEQGSIVLDQTFWLASPIIRGTRLSVNW